MANAERRLKELKKDYQEAKNDEIRIQTKLEEAKKRRKTAHEKIKEKGYDVKDLSKVIKDKEDQLDQTLNEIEAFLPGSDDEEEFDYE